jgi:phosphatidylinositol-3-phosphatase
MRHHWIAAALRHAPCRIVVSLALVLTFLAGCGGSSNKNSSNNVLAVPAASHVFLVVLENHSFSQVIGSPAMPYLNSLASQGALATDYFANTHPSIGNYFMLTVGNEETNNDAFSGMVSDNNIVRALTQGGKSWKAYLESLPSVGYTGGDVLPLYLKQHNPFAYLSDVLNSSSQTANMVPFSQFSSDLAANNLASFVFIAPNNENNAHDCPGGAASCADTDKLAAADAWLRNNIDPLIHSSNFGNSLLIITWDESVDTDTADGGGQVATVLIGPHVRGGFRSSMMHQHQDTLRTILQALGISNNLPNAAGTANTLGDMLQ